MNLEPSGHDNGFTRDDTPWIVGEVDNARLLTEQLRSIRLQEMARIRDLAYDRLEDDVQAVTFHGNGVPGGASTRSDVRFGFEVEFQFSELSYDQQAKVLEKAGYIDWKDGKDLLNEADNAHTDKWAMVGESVHDLGVELVSPILRHTADSATKAGTWNALRTLAEKVQATKDREGTEPDARTTGEHINFSFTPEAQLKPHEYARPAQLGKGFEKILFQLGNHTETASNHRRLDMVGPNPIPDRPENVRTYEDVRKLSSGKFDAINFQHVLGTPDDWVEFLELLELSPAAQEQIVQLFSSFPALADKSSAVVEAACRAPGGRRGPDRIPGRPARRDQSRRAHTARFAEVARVAVNCGGVTVASPCPRIPSSRMPGEQRKVHYGFRD